jgi:hypothetical protein
LVLAKVILGFAQNVVDFPIGSPDADFSWFLEGVEDLSFVENSYGKLAIWSGLLQVIMITYPR